MGHKSTCRRGGENCYLYGSFENYVKHNGAPLMVDIKNTQQGITLK